MYIVNNKVNGIGILNDFFRSRMTLFPQINTSPSSMSWHPMVQVFSCIPTTWSRYYSSLFKSEHYPQKPIQVLQACHGHVTYPSYFKSEDYPYKPMQVLPVYLKTPR